eukprot:3794-Heterococcus_DN1.PRE.6
MTHQVASHYYSPTPFVSAVACIFATCTGNECAAVQDTRAMAANDLKQPSNSREHSRRFVTQKSLCHEAFDEDRANTSRATRDR